LFDEKHTETRDRIKKFQNSMEKELASDFASVCPEYHKHMKVVILEQNILP
jgi:hypothetical protein